MRRSGRRAPPRSPPAAGLSMAVKQAMSLYTRRAGKILRSESLSATAWNYQADVWTSLGSFAGVLGARLGASWADPVASLVICALIVRVALRVARDAVDHLVDHACDPETEHAMRAAVLSQPGVVALDSLQTRMFRPARLRGHRHQRRRLPAADRGARHRRARARRDRAPSSPDVKHCMVHVNPATTT